MNKKFTKRVMTGVIALSMVVTMFGCAKPSVSEESSKEQSSSSESGSSEVTGQTLEDVPKPTKDPLEKYDPEIDVSLIHTDTTAAFWFPEGEDLENNIYTRTYKDTLGINYSFKWTCPGPQATEKKNTMYASGDLPDFMSVDRKDFEKLQKAGLLADLTTPIIEYASEYTRQYLTGEYSGLLDAATKDGKYYGLTNGMSYKDNGTMVWLRKDWLDKLGLEIPKTMDELEVVMKAFTEKDPDGNGQNDTYGMAMGTASQTPWSWTLDNSFLNSYNSYPGVWYKNSKGEIEQGMFGEESRARTRLALEKGAEFYQKGYINKEVATMDSEMRNQDIFSDKTGVFFEGIWGAYWPLVLHRDSSPEADWIAIPNVAGIENGGNNPVNDVNVSGILVATKNAKNPEALVKMSNLYHDLNNNPETMKFDEYNTWPTDSNQIFLAYPLLIFNPSFNYEGYKEISAAQESGKTDGLSQAYKMFYDQAIDFEKNGANGGFAPYRTYFKGDTALSVVDSYIENNKNVFNEFTVEPTEFMIENEPTIKKLYDEMAINVIMGKSDITAYDEFIKQYDTTYGETATKEVNEWFKANGGESIQDRLTK